MEIDPHARGVGGELIERHAAEAPLADGVLEAAGGILAVGWVAGLVAAG